jgi:hypothetical protein
MCHPFSRSIAAPAPAAHTSNDAYSDDESSRSVDFGQRAPGSARGFDATACGTNLDDAAALTHQGRAEQGAVAGRSGTDIPHLTADQTKQKE